MIDKKVLILEGGLNEEHDVSLVTSNEIQKILKLNKIQFKTLKVNPKNFHEKIINYKKFVCINALHGPFGEDGQIQKILKENKIPFSHSNFKSSNILSNSHLFYIILPHPFKIKCSKSFFYYIAIINRLLMTSYYCNKLIYHKSFKDNCLNFD